MDSKWKIKVIGNSDRTATKLISPTDVAPAGEVESQIVVSYVGSFPSSPPPLKAVFLPWKPPHLDVQIFVPGRLGYSR